MERPCETLIILSTILENGYNHNREQTPEHIGSGVISVTVIYEALFFAVGVFHDAQYRTARLNLAADFARQLRTP